MSSSGDEGLRSQRNSGFEGDFSGFERDDIPMVGANIEIRAEEPLSKNKNSNKHSNKEVAQPSNKEKQKSKQKKTKTKSQNKPKSKKSKKNNIDLENFTSDDIAQLKKKLGLSSGLQPDNYDDEVFFEPDYNDFDEFHNPDQI
jgi:hypothetical protein